MTLNALIFDVDGTLADTEKNAHRVAFNQAFADNELDWDWDVELYGQLLAVTGGKERIKYYLEKFNTNFLKPDNFDEFVADLHAQKTQIYKQLMLDGKIPLRTGVERLIHEARANNIRLAIATTTTYLNVTSLLESTLGKESIEWFEVIAAGDVVPAKKPAADIYLYALEKLNLKAADCLALEDSDNGLRSAKDAGLKTVITINDYTRNHDFSEAELVISGFGDDASPAEILSQKALYMKEQTYFTMNTARAIIENQER